MGTEFSITRVTKYHLPSDLKNKYLFFSKFQGQISEIKFPTLKLRGCRTPSGSSRWESVAFLFRWLSALPGLWPHPPGSASLIHHVLFCCRISFCICHINTVMMVCRAHLGNPQWSLVSRSLVDPTVKSCFCHIRQHLQLPWTRVWIFFVSWGQGAVIQSSTGNSIWNSWFDHICFNWSCQHLPKANLFICH